MRFKIYRKGGYGSGGFSETGGSVTGPVMLPGDPTEPLHAATKGYIDTKLHNLSGSDIKSGHIPVESMPGISGDLTSVSGSNVLTLSNTGVSTGSYAKVRVDAKGRVIGGYTLSESDLPEMSWDKIGSGKPSTLAGYGVNDALTPSGGTLTGVLKINASPVNALDIVNKTYIDGLSAGSDGELTVGDVVRKVSNVTPTGFLRCNGGQVSKTDYAALYSVIGDAYNFSGPPGSGQPWRQQYDINKIENINSFIWTPSQSLPTTNVSFNIVVTKNRVYVLGGFTGAGTVTANISTATIDNNGILSNWSAAGDLLYPLYGGQAIVTKNRVYLIGVSRGTADTDQTYTCPINSDGTLGAWSFGPKLPIAMTSSNVFLTKTRIYVTGPQIRPGDKYKTTYYSIINEDGTIGPWVQDIGKDLINTTDEATPVVTRNKVYVGRNFANILSDGSISEWYSTVGVSGHIDSQGNYVLCTNTKVYYMGLGNTINKIVNILEDGTISTSTTNFYGPGNDRIINARILTTSSRLYLLGGNNLSAAGYSANCYYTLFNGGLNDYSPYYDGTILPTDPNNFRLPDYTTKELPGSYTYIKT